MERATEASTRLQKVLDGETHLEEWNELEDELDKSMGFTAFETCEKPAEMRVAADYADEWFNQCGRSFRVYYVCMSGPSDDPCCTLILNKCWKTLHEDPMAAGQRWYCTCGKRCVTKYGVVCEFAYGPHDVRYCRAECPDDTFKDVKFTRIEQDNKNCSTPEALYAAIPTVRPLDRGEFMRETATEGHYKFDRRMFEGLGKPVVWRSLCSTLFK